MPLLTLLVLFYVRATFDPTDPEILLKRLQLSFGLSGNFLNSLASFLYSRSLCMGPNGSSPLMAFPGLGAVPLLYIIYTSELGPLLTAHAVPGQLYADGIQAYLHCLASNKILTWR